MSCVIAGDVISTDTRQRKAKHFRISYSFYLYHVKIILVKRQIWDKAKINFKSGLECFIFKIAAFRYQVNHAISYTFLPVNFFVLINFARVPTE